MKEQWILTTPHGTVKIENKQSYKAALALLEILKSKYDENNNTIEWVTAGSHTQYNTFKKWTADSDLIYHLN